MIAPLVLLLAAIAGFVLWQKREVGAIAAPPIEPGPVVGPRATPISQAEPEVPPAPTKVLSRISGDKIEIRIVGVTNLEFDGVPAKLQQAGLWVSGDPEEGVSNLRGDARTRGGGYDISSDRTLIYDANLVDESDQPAMGAFAVHRQYGYVIQQIIGYFPRISYGYYSRPGYPKGGEVWEWNVSTNTLKRV